MSCSGGGRGWAPPWRGRGPVSYTHLVGVVLTKTADNYPSLTERANISNKSKPDCFVSIHTNAYGEGGWSSASGLEIYTSAGPMTAQRNVLASELVNTFHAAGVSLRNEPIKHEMYTCLLYTSRCV